MSATKRKRTSTRKERALTRTLARNEAECRSLKVRIQQLEQYEQQRGGPIEIINVSSDEEDANEEQEHEQEAGGQQEEEAAHVAPGLASGLPPLGTSTNAYPSKAGSTILPYDADAISQSLDAGLAWTAPPLLWDRCADECVIIDDVKNTKICVAPSVDAHGLHSFDTPVVGTVDVYPWELFALSKPFDEKHVFTIVDSRPRTLYSGCHFHFKLAVRSSQYPLVADQPLPSLTNKQLRIDFNIQKNILSWQLHKTNSINEVVHQVQVHTGDHLMLSLCSKAWVSQAPLYPIVELRNTTSYDEGLRVVHLEEAEDEDEEAEDNDEVVLQLQQLTADPLPIGSGNSLAWQQNGDALFSLSSSS